MDRSHIHKIKNEIEHEKKKITRSITAIITTTTTRLQQIKQRELNGIELN